MDKIDEILKKSYNNIKVNDNINKKIDYKIKKYKQYNNMKMVASFSILILITTYGLVSFFNEKSNNEDKSLYIAESPIIDNNISNNQVSKELPIPSEKIEISTAINGDLNMIYEPENIVIAKIEEIVEYITINPETNEVSLPVTKYKANNIKNIKGNTKETFEFIKSGGVISLAEYEKRLSEEQKIKKGLDKKSESEKKSTYLEIITSLELNQAKVIPGNTYLICMRYDADVYNELSTIAVKIGIMEYDQSTNCVKDNKTDMWIDLEEFLSDKNM